MSTEGQWRGKRALPHKKKGGGGGVRVGVGGGCSVYQITLAYLRPVEPGSAPPPTPPPPSHEHRVRSKTPLANSARAQIPPCSLHRRPKHHMKEWRLHNAERTKYSSGARFRICTPSSLRIYNYAQLGYANVYLNI